MIQTIKRIFGVILVVATLSISINITKVDIADLVVEDDSDYPKSIEQDI